MKKVDSSNNFDPRNGLVGTASSNNSTKRVADAPLSEADLRVQKVKHSTEIQHVKWEDLPDEVWAHMSNFLNPLTITRIRQVSRRMREAGDIMLISRLTQLGCQKIGAHPGPYMNNLKSKLKEVNERLEVKQCVPKSPESPLIPSLPLPLAKNLPETLSNLMSAKISTDVMETALKIQDFVSISFLFSRWETTLLPLIDEIKSKFLSGEEDDNLVEELIEASNLAIREEKTSAFNIILKSNVFKHDLAKKRIKLIECAVEHNKLNFIETLFDFHMMLEENSSMPHLYREIKQNKLSQNIDVNCQDRFGMTPLHFAVVFNQKDILMELLESKAEIDRKDINGQTPLHHAVLFGHYEIIEALLEKGANPNCYDLEGSQPLHVAAAFGRAAAVNPLVKKGAEIENLYMDTTAFSLAAQNDDVDAMEALLNNGANINATSFDGETPLHTAASEGCLKSIAFLVGKGLNPNSTSGSHNDTPLHTAAIFNETEAIRLLISLGAVTNKKDKEGLTPLHVAASMNSIDAMLELLRNGAHINEMDKKRNSPLHFAAKNGTFHAAKILIENGAAIFKNRSGKTPLMLAEEGEHRRVIEILTSSTVVML